MSSVIHGSFDVALRGQNGRVVQIPHPIVTFLAQNDNGHAALVANVTLSAHQVVPDGKGFFAKTERSGSDHFVRLVSAEAGLSLLFLKLVDYVLDRTAEARDRSEAALLLVRSVDEFKRFTQRRTGRLSESEIRGLVPELLLLLHLQNGDESRTWDVFHAWGGPFGALHDFTFAEGNVVEVKSTHRPPSEIRITTPAQLSPVPDGLDLVVLPLEKVAPGVAAEVQFVDLVHRVSSLAKSHGGDVANLWESALDALGIDLLDQYYEQWSFAVGDWLRFTVTEDFPRIHEAHIPAGVVKVAFTLRLESLKEFATDFAGIGEMS